MADDGSQPSSTFAVEAPAGFLRANPEAAVRALSRIAEAEGADPELWLLKAASSVVQVRVGGEPRYAVVPEATRRARVIYEALMAAATDEIVAMLAARAAETSSPQGSD